MKRIKISAEFEREIRAHAEGCPITDKLIKLLDSEEPKKTPGIGYAKIVELLRVSLGPRLAVPEAPHVSWIIKQVNRVKELGLSEQQIRELGARAAGVYNNSRPIELEFILRAAVRILSAGSPKQEAGRVYTGRDEE
jgi:hypothetical protein